MIKILLSGRFARRMRKMPRTIQELADEKSIIFSQNPFDPQLKTHKLQGKMEGYWAFSIDYQIRAIFKFVGKSTALFYSIGKHDIYD